MELQYINLSGASNILVTVTDHVDDFLHGDYCFMKLDVEGKLKFFQVIETEQFSCYVHWKKKLIPFYNHTDLIEQFTKPAISYQLHMEGDTLSFKSRKTFAACFTESRQKEIRRLLRQNHLSFRRAEPDAIIRSMHEVSNLLNPEFTP